MRISLSRKTFILISRSLSLLGKNIICNFGHYSLQETCMTVGELVLLSFLTADFFVVKTQAIIKKKERKDKNNKYQSNSIFIS